MQLAGIGGGQQFDQREALRITRSNSGQIGGASWLSLPIEIGDRGALRIACRSDPRATCQDLIDNDLERREQRAGISGKAYVGCGYRHSTGSELQ